jgi:hypothetical protein
MAQFLSVPFLQASDNTSAPLAGAKLYIYQTATTTLLSLYSDEALTSPISNPVVADSAGVFAAAFINETRFKMVLTNAAGTTLYTRDPVYSTGRQDNISGSNVTFDGSSIGFSSTNVQAAILELYTTLPKLTGADFTGTLSTTGELKFNGADSAANTTTFSSITPTILDTTDTSEDGKVEIKTMLAGAFAARLSVAGGVWATRALGGDKGRDTTNLGTLFVNGLPTSARLLSGLKVEATSATQVQVTANGSLSVTAAITASGANGLDTGAEGSSTWYNVFVIWNGTIAAALLSTSATAPTMPTGYTQKVRVGAVYNDGSSNFWRTVQYGSRAQVVVGTNPTVPNIAGTGAVGDVATPTYVAIAVASYMPPTAFVVYGYVANPQNATGIFLIAPNNTYGGDASTTKPPLINGSTTNGGGVFSLVLESTSFYWASSDATARLIISGWEDNL